MKPWFTIEQLDEDSYIISEYRHWEETHCYLLNGTRRSLLIDTGLGIGNIQGEIRNLTDKPVTPWPPMSIGITLAGIGISPGFMPTKQSSPG